MIVLLGQEWHLCKSDWNGESADKLDDPEDTLSSLGINHGDTLIVEVGQPPPRVTI